MASCSKENPKSAFFPKSHLLIFKIRVFVNYPNPLLPTNVATNQDFGESWRAIIVATTCGTPTAMDTHKVALAAVAAPVAAELIMLDSSLTGAPAYANPSESLTTLAEVIVIFEYVHFAAILESE